jgi:hypothetical protein
MIGRVAAFALRGFVEPLQEWSGERRKRFGSRCSEIIGPPPWSSRASRAIRPRNRDDAARGGAAA